MNEIIVNKNLIKNKLIKFENISIDKFPILIETKAVTIRKNK